MADLTRVPESAEAADWLVERVVTFAESVLSLVPSGFDAYARILHPAEQEDRAITWAEVAESTGRVVHPEMQWAALVGAEYYEPGRADCWDRAPATGTLPPEVARPLVANLSQQTKSPQGCWFAIWDGWGDLSTEIARAPAFDLPHRRYHLLAGPIEAAIEPQPQSQRSASIWWPSDRTWCVATEIDLDSSYVGGSFACIDQILASGSFEAFKMGPTNGITIASDAINPQPALRAKGR
jgi:hypothetical protein